MQTKSFILLKKFKNTESALLCKLIAQQQKLGWFQIGNVLQTENVEANCCERVLKRICEVR